MESVPRIKLPPSNLSTPAAVALSKVYDWSLRKESFSPVTDWKKYFAGFPLASVFADDCVFVQPNARYVKLPPGAPAFPVKFVGWEAVRDHQAAAFAAAGMTHIVEARNLTVQPFVNDPDYAWGSVTTVSNHILPNGKKYLLEQDFQGVVRVNADGKIVQIEDIWNPAPVQAIFDAMIAAAAETLDKA